TAGQIGSMLGARVMLLLPGPEERVRVLASWPSTDTVDDVEVEDAQLAWAASRPGSTGSEVLRIARRLFLPLRTSHGVIGLVGVSRDQPGTALSLEERRLVEALLAQAAVAVERVRLGQERDE